MSQIHATVLAICITSPQYRDDLDYLPVIASLPPDETVFEYLVGCWKRQNAVRTSLSKKVSKMPFNTNA